MGEGRRSRAPERVLRAAVACVLLALVAAAALHLAFGIDALSLASFAPPCLVRALTGIPCPGCGMTRALLLLAQLRLGESLAAHPAAPLLLAAMVSVLLRGPRPLPHARAWASGLLAAVVALWIGRIVGA